MRPNLSLNLAQYTALGMIDKRSKTPKLKESVYDKRKKNKVLKPKYQEAVNKIERKRRAINRNINRNNLVKITDLTEPNEFNIRILGLKGGDDRDDNVFMKNLKRVINRNKRYAFRVIATLPIVSKTVSTRVLTRALTNSDLIELIGKMNAYGDYNTSELEYSVQYYDTPRGAGGLGLPKWLQNKRSIIEIKNDDNLCGQRCLVLGLMNDQQRKDITKTKKISAFKKRAIKLSKEIQCESAMCFTDFKKFTDIYKEYNVKIYDGVSCIFEIGVGEKEISIFYDSSIKHYHYVIKVESFMKKQNGDKYCEKCKMTYKRKCDCYKDNKKTICRVCQGECSFKVGFKNNEKKICAYTRCCNITDWRDDINVEVEENNFPCFKCKKMFNEKCNYVKYTEQNEIHEDNINITDEKVLLYKRKCGMFNKGDTRCNLQHACGYSYCTTCDRTMPLKHRCIIPSKQLPKGKSGYARVWSFDMESVLEDGQPHKPTLIIAKLRGDGVESDRTEKWEGDNCLDEFTKFCIEEGNIKSVKTKMIAHNARGYDTWLLHRHMKKHTGTRPDKIVMAGAKIMYMKFKNVDFIDSLNHIQSKLSKFPKTFGLDETKFKKGFYPYKFNKKENGNYVGFMPDIGYFDSDLMSKDDIAEFNKWYDEKVDSKYVWDHKKETLEYCISDVDILHQSLCIYSKDGMELNGIDPLQYTTIASYCMAVFRINHYNPSKTPLCVLTRDEYEFSKRGFYGGRTEATKLYRKWNDEEKLKGCGGKYQDVQSLYPTVQYYDELPYGEPINRFYDKKDYIENAKIIKENYGFFEVDVECNKSLYCPILPAYEIIDGDKKLTFSSMNKNKMVFHSVELNNAINHGYRVTRIYRSMCFKTSTEIFKSYIAKFLEIKVNCSGKPNIVGELFNEWVREHQIRFGFKPEPNKNAGRKAIAKLCLNSLWGKFSQNPDQLKTEYMKRDNWFRLLKECNEGKVEINTVLIDDRETLYVSYKDLRDYKNDVLNTTNLALGASITSNARTRLHSELSKLDDRVIYMDTDSIVYEYDPSKYNIREGLYLGEWESETSSLIDEFTTTGAKTYGFKCPDDEDESNHIVLKCKGITLNVGNTDYKGVTFENLRSLVCDEDYDKITTNHNLRFDLKEAGIFSKKMKKDLIFTANKRERKGNDSYPFGYSVKN